MTNPSKSSNTENINTWLSQIKTDYKTAVSVDCVIFGYDEGQLRILVMKSDMPPFEGQYSLIGDLLRPDETLDQSASRILSYRTGLEDVYMEQVNTFSKIDRHPLGRVITVAYYSLLKLDHRLKEITKTHPTLKWKKVNEIENLAFDHKEIFDICLEKLQVQLRDKPIGFNLLPKKFSLKELQNLYEVVLNIKLDKRNFRRKLSSLDILIDHNESQTNVNHRPGKLYSFDQENYQKKLKKGFNFEL